MPIVKRIAIYTLKQSISKSIQKGNIKMLGDNLYRKLNSNSNPLIAESFGNELDTLKMNTDEKMQIIYNYLCNPRLTGVGQVREISFFV